MNKGRFPAHKLKIYVYETEIMEACGGNLTHKLAGNLKAGLTATQGKKII